MLDQGVRTQPHALPPVEAIGHLVVVPRATGPLLDLDASRGRTVDDLDEAIDDLFGETTQEPPGLLDAALVSGGVLVAGWALLSSAPVPVLILGVATALLGVALPARAVVGVSRERRQAATRRRAIGDGLPLDSSDPSVHALVGAYDACLKIATRPDAPRGRDAAEAAHLAMVEVASLLAGQRPVADAELEYVRKRTQAIGRLTLSLQRTQRGRVEARLDASIHQTPAQRHWATAVTEAREELDSATGLGSLDRLTDLAATTEREAHDAAR